MAARTTSDSARCIRAACATTPPAWASTNFAQIRAAVKIPIVAIGGITEARIAETLAAGADAVAIITDVVNAPDIPAKVRSILALERN